jgi:hypothetical protein
MNKKPKHSTSVIIQKLNNIHPRVAVLAFALWGIVASIYWFYGDYTSDVWHLVFYIPLYFALMWACLVLRASMVQKEYRLYFSFWGFFFFAMTMEHAACLYKIEWYSAIVSGTFYYGIGFITMVTGIIWLLYKLGALDPDA